jgi:cytochrome c biogenesis factor
MLLGRFLLFVGMVGAALAGILLPVVLAFLLLGDAIEGNRPHELVELVPLAAALFAFVIMAAIGRHLASRRPD